MILRGDCQSSASSVVAYGRFERLGLARRNRTACFSTVCGDWEQDETDTDEPCHDNERVRVLLHRNTVSFIENFPWGFGSVEYDVT